MKIPDFPQYDISEDGVVTRISTGRPVKARLNYGRLLITLIDRSYKHRTVTLMSIMAETYLGPKPGPDYVASTKDGNRLHITADNVIWRTRSAISKEFYNPEQGRRPVRSYNQDSVDLVLNTLEQCDYPVRMSELSYVLQVPYSTIRYSMLKLLDAGLARKTDFGYEVIK